MKGIKHILNDFREYVNKTGDQCVSEPHGQEETRRRATDPSAGQPLHGCCQGSDEAA